MAALMALIDRLEQTAPKTGLETYQTKQRRDGRRYWGESFIHQYFQAHKNTDEIHKNADNLGFMVTMASGVLDDWLTLAIIKPPAYARRIGIILGKAKMPALRARFDAAWQRHMNEGDPAI